MRHDNRKFEHCLPPRFFCRLNPKGNSNHHHLSFLSSSHSVAFFDIGRGSSGYLSTPRDKAGLLSYGRRAGARIHSASWGSEYNGYGIDEYYFDRYLHSNDDFLLVIAAGNSGPSRGSIGSPATSKNCLSVGASQSAGGDITSNMDGPEFLARFSSRGPTR